MRTKGESVYAGGGDGGRKLLRAPINFLKGWGDNGEQVVNRGRSGDGEKVRKQSKRIESGLAPFL